MWPIEPGEFTTADLDAAPDEGARYELVDGVLLLTHMSSLVHQRALGNLLMQMVPACPDYLEVLHGPLEFRPNSRLAVVPDLLVLPYEDSATRWVENLALAVEVVVSTTRTVDRVLKPVLYERAGVPAYWLLDAEEATLTVLELVAGSYVERAVVAEGGVFEAEVPFPVRVGVSRSVAW
ncbi:Uma2 family endonuclease [Kribbella speibonae]|uniref:Uma2 family endonuclease n=1 Tax=Kribbella speibonae TaxID=1572660 RepID=A0ABY1ZVD2_9ACTN|nr:Uma2 family endonuclease [Kribbella speibonae]TCC18252.1 Uma2 family endonuclease [Kribbella speibonae]